MSLDFEGAARDVLDEIDDPVKRLTVSQLFAQWRARAEAARWHIHLPDGTVMHTWIPDHDDHPPEIVHMITAIGDKRVVYEVAEADLETRHLVLKLVQ